MTTERIIRVLVAKPGLDGHDRGARVIAHAFRDAGFEVIYTGLRKTARQIEVIYTGLRKTARQIVNAALQEDVDVIGISVLSGAHMTLCPRIMELIREAKLDDVLVIVGGIVPGDDIAQLKDAGIREVFGPGTSTGEIVRYIRDNVRPIQIPTDN